jgi:hypothetical protein
MGHTYLAALHCHVYIGTAALSSCMQLVACRVLKKYRYIKPDESYMISCLSWCEETWKLVSKDMH